MYNVVRLRGRVFGASFGDAFPEDEPYRHDFGGASLGGVEGRSSFIT